MIVKIGLCFIAVRCVITNLRVVLMQIGLVAVACHARQCI